MKYNSFILPMLMLNACMASSKDMFVKVYKDIRQTSLLDMIMSDEELFLKVATPDPYNLSSRHVSLKTIFSLIYYGLMLGKTKFEPSHDSKKLIMRNAVNVLSSNFADKEWRDFLSSSFLDLPLFHQYFTGNLFLLYQDYQNYDSEMSKQLLQGNIEAKEKVFAEEQWREFFSSPSLDLNTLHNYFSDNLHLLSQDHHYDSEVAKLLLQGKIDAKEQVLLWCSSSLTTQLKLHTLITHTDDTIFVMMLLFHTPEHLMEGLVRDWRVSVGNRNNSMSTLWDALLAAKSEEDRLRAFIAWSAHYRETFTRWPKFQAHGHLRKVFDVAVREQAWDVVNSILNSLPSFAQVIDYLSSFPREHLCKLQPESNGPYCYHHLFIWARFMIRDQIMTKWANARLSTGLFLPESVAVTAKADDKFEFPDEILRHIFIKCCDYDPLQVIFDIPLVCKQWNQSRLQKYEVIAAGKQFSLFLAKQSHRLSDPLQPLILEGIRCVLTTPDLIDTITSSDARRCLVENLKHGLSTMHYEHPSEYCRLIDACKANIKIPSSWNSVSALTAVARHVSADIKSFQNLVNEMSGALALTLYFEVLIPPNFSQEEITALRRIIIRVFPEELVGALYKILTSQDKEYSPNDVVAFIETDLTNVGLLHLLPSYKLIYLYAHENKEIMAGYKSSDLIPLMLTKMIASNRYTDADLAAHVKQHESKIINFLAANPILEDEHLDRLIRLLPEWTLTNEKIIELVYLQNAHLLPELVAKAINE